MNKPTDQELLCDYARRGAEGAFAELVSRHLDLVFSAALRMVRDTHLAKDVTQGVFIALAQNARCLTDRPALSGWLHRTARNIAAQTVRTEARRRLRERESVAINASPFPECEAPWARIAPHLDEALEQLSEADRGAIFLRYFQGKSAREMAAMLGTGEEAAQRRVGRAVERLRGFLLKRGVAISAGGLAMLVSTKAVQSAPAGLAAAVSAAVLAGSASCVPSLITAIKTLSMSAAQKKFITATVAVAIGAGIYEAHRAARLASENWQLRRQQAEQARQWQDELDAASAKLAGLQAENARLALNQKDLLRLRAAAARSRKQILAEEDQSKTSARLTGPAGDGRATNAPPAFPYSANVRVTVPWGETLATGGWRLPSGSRAIVLATPARSEDPAHAQIETQVVELSEAAAEKLGFDQLNTEDRDVKSAMLITADKVQALLKAARDSGEIRLIAGTASADMGLVTQTELGLAGPVLGFLPIKSSADGTGLEWQLTAKLGDTPTHVGDH